MQTANPARIPIRRRANFISNFRGGSNVAYHKPRQKRKRQKRALAGDAGGELAEGVHCGSDFELKQTKANYSAVKGFFANFPAGSAALSGFRAREPAQKPRPL